MKDQWLWGRSLPKALPLSQIPIRFKAFISYYTPKEKLPKEKFAIKEKGKINGNIFPQAGI
jgi:hypothetical protein